VDQSDIEIAETGVQRAMAALTLSDVAVRGKILERIAPNSLTALDLLRVVRSVTEQDGESDLLIDWSGPNGVIFRALIEVKLTAHFMPDQGKRYRRRADRAIQTGQATHVSTALVAPAAYLANGNVQINEFDYSISLEEFVGWTEQLAAPESLYLRASLERVLEGKPLGAKGLYRGVHDLLSDELDRRTDGFRVTNNATNWVFIDHPQLGQGVRLRYRIRDSIAEIRLNKSFGSTERIAPPQSADIACLRRGTETLFRHRPVPVSAEAKHGAPTSMDITLIADVLEHLVKWWRSAAA
jgi:hypothetical protein